jgi:hypothetical protein
MVRDRSNQFVFDYRIVRPRSIKPAACDIIVTMPRDPRDALRCCLTVRGLPTWRVTARPNQVRHERDLILERDDLESGAQSTAPRAEP